MAITDEGRKILDYQRFLREMPGPERAIIEGWMIAMREEVAARAPRAVFSENQALIIILNLLARFGPGSKMEL